MGEPQVECRCNGTMSNIFMSKAIQGEGMQVDEHCVDELVEGV